MKTLRCKSSEANAAIRTNFSRVNVFRC